MSALPESRIIAMNLDTRRPFPQLHGLVAAARADHVLVALLIELEQDYPLTVPVVGEWLAVLIDTSNGITCMAVVCQTTRVRLMVSGMALAAKRRKVLTPIDCFRTTPAATLWLGASTHGPTPV